MNNYDRHFDKVAPISEGAKMEDEREEFLEKMKELEETKKMENEKGIKPLNVVPLGDKVLLYQVKEEEEKTAEGLILAGTVVKEPNRAVVVAVGVGRTSEDGSKQPMTVKVGDSVVFNPQGCVDIIYEGVSYKVLPERDIIFIVNK